MKTLSLLLSVLFAAALSQSAFAQTKDQNTLKTVASKTESFKVFGNCELCKARIENAVKEEGASAASWDTKTKMLTVTYDPLKTNKDKLSKKLASVGHDTESYKAPDDVYDKLPACCHYERANKD
jgi:mercuric ion binding protein